jgi:hypothetical protein
MSRDVMTSPEQISEDLSQYYSTLNEALARNLPSWNPEQAGIQHSNVFAIWRGLTSEDAPLYDVDYDEQRAAKIASLLGEVASGEDVIIAIDDDPIYGRVISAEATQSNNGGSGDSNPDKLKTGVDKMAFFSRGDVDRFEAYGVGYLPGLLTALERLYSHLPSDVAPGRIVFIVDNHLDKFGYPFGCESTPSQNLVWGEDLIGKLSELFPASDYALLSADDVAVQNIERHRPLEQAFIGVNKNMGRDPYDDTSIYQKVQAKRRDLGLPYMTE